MRERLVFSLAWECDWVSWGLEREGEREVDISECQGKINWTSVPNTYIIVGFNIVYNWYNTL